MNKVPTISNNQETQVRPKTIWSKNKFRNSSLFANCTNCYYSSTCIRDESCSFLQAPQASTEDSIEIELIRKLSPPSPSRKMKAGIYDRYAAIDTKTPTYQYHRHIVNDCLKDIRAGRTGYLYTQQCLHDLFCFEPTARVSKQDGVYYISLNKGDTNGTDDIDTGRQSNFKGVVS